MISLSGEICWVGWGCHLEATERKVETEVKVHLPNSTVTHLRWGCNVISEVRSCFSHALLLLIKQKMKLFSQQGFFDVKQCSNIQPHTYVLE